MLEEERVWAAVSDKGTAWLCSWVCIVLDNSFFWSTYCGHWSWIVKLNSWRWSNVCVRLVEHWVMLTVLVWDEWLQQDHRGGRSCSSEDDLQTCGSSRGSRLLSCISKIHSTNVCCHRKSRTACCTLWHRKCCVGALRYLVLDNRPSQMHAFLFHYSKRTSAANPWWKLWPCFPISQQTVSVFEG